MKLQSLSSQHQRIKQLLILAHQFGESQAELQAHWARYLCVISAGFLENALKEIYSHYARKCSNRAVSDFVESTLRKIQNPKASRFIETATAFDKSWGETLSQFMDNEGRRDAIDAIMANRNLIAHGKDSGISLARLKDYLSKSVEVIEFIENQCGLGT